MSIVKKGFGVELYSHKFTCENCDCVFTQNEQEFLFCVDIENRKCTITIGALCLDCKSNIIECKKYPMIIKSRIRQKFNNIRIGVPGCEYYGKLQAISVIEKKTWFGLSSETHLIIENHCSECNYGKHIVNITNIGFPKDILKMIQNSTINRT